MPAPPDGSDAASVMTIGGNSDSGSEAMLRRRARHAARRGSGLLESQFNPLNVRE
jgi:hypothetical protein